MIRIILRFDQNVTRPPKLLDPQVKELTTSSISARCILAYTSEREKGTLLLFFENQFAILKRRPQRHHLGHFIERNMLHLS